jgi:hypothetical protein
VPPLQVPQQEQDMAVKKIIVSGITDDPIRTLVEQFNDLLAKIDVLTAKLNADAGVTDTNYATDFVSTLKVQDTLTGSDV